MTCKDCMHFKVCNSWDSYRDRTNNFICRDFDNSSYYIELPCKIGDTVYEVGYYSDEDQCFIRERPFSLFLFDRIGKNIFTTRAEAEAKINIGQKSITCDCYHEKEVTNCVYDIFDGDKILVKKVIGECWETKEKNECSCGGDKRKCDFYNNTK